MRSVHVRRRVLFGLASLLSLILIVGLGAYLYGMYRFAQVHKVSVGSLMPTGSGSSENILLVGNSCRTCLNGKQTSAFGSAAQAGNGGGSDVMMILHLDFNNHSAVLVSLPRDSFVPIAGSNAFNRLNSAFDSGSTNLVKTIEQDYGIPINHYMEVNFDTFQKVVAKLGGVNMYFPFPVKDAYSGLNVQQPGCHHLNGFGALAVVRARHLYFFANGTWQPDGLGDISRIKRDHEFLRVVASSVKAGGLNPIRINSVLSSIVPDIKVDSGLTYNSLVNMALTFKGLNPSTLPSSTLPVYLSNQSLYSQGYDFGQVVFPVQPADSSVISSQLGVQIPPVHPGTNVQVLNGSGLYNQATDISQQLASLGEHISGIGDTSIASSPAETVIYYAPGEMGQALALQNHMSGTVTMAPASNLPSGVQLRVVTGSYLSVIVPSGSSSSNTSPPGGNAAPPSGNGSSVSIGTTPATSSLPAWDPRACPPGMPVTPAN